MNHFYIPSYYFYSNNLKEKKSYNNSTGNLDFHRFVQNKPCYAIEKQEQNPAKKTIILQNFFELVKKKNTLNWNYVQIIQLFLLNEFKVYAAFQDGLKPVETPYDIKNFLKSTEYTLKEDIRQQARKEALEEDKCFIVDFFEYMILFNYYFTTKTLSDSNFTTQELKKENIPLYELDFTLNQKAKKILRELSKEKRIILFYTSPYKENQEKLREYIKEKNYTNILPDSEYKQENLPLKCIEGIYTIQRVSFVFIDIFLYQNGTSSSSCINNLKQGTPIIPIAFIEQQKTTSHIFGKKGNKYKIISLPEISAYKKSLSKFLIKHNYLNRIAHKDENGFKGFFSYVVDEVIIPRLLKILKIFT